MRTRPRRLSIAKVVSAHCQRFKRAAVAVTCLLCTPVFADGPTCDRLASIIADPERRAPPVNYAGIDASRVIESCHQAITQDPNNGRYWVQLGRGYLKRDEGVKMLDAFERARTLQYPVAWFALAVSYHTGNGVAKSDRARAERLYLEAYQRGIGFAALGLARLYDEHGSDFFDAERAALWQTRFDAFQARGG
jgi:hypothetical protein